MLQIGQKEPGYKKGRIYIPVFIGILRGAAARSVVDTTQICDVAVRRGSAVR
jgi:hypothetical protein